MKFIMTIIFLLAQVLLIKISQKFNVEYNSFEKHKIINQHHQSSLEKGLPNVDPNLVHRVMYLERKLSTEYIKEPQVTMMIEYKSGLDMDKKLFDLREDYSLEAEYSDEYTVLFSMGRMKVDKLTQIASDGDIVKITRKGTISFVLPQNLAILPTPF